MTFVLTMLAVLAGFFALMLALDPRRRKRAAYGATVALTAGAFGLADNIPTVGGDALAQPGCDWNVGAAIPANSWGRVAQGLGGR